MRWDIICIGNLSRNRYWGEDERKAIRPALCTCTLVAGDGFRLLVDPALVDAESMAAELNRRTGFRPAGVTAVFVTHEHGDHHAGLRHFPGAQWFAPPEAAEAVNRSRNYDKPIVAVTGRLFDGVDIIPTPGHTPGHHSLRLELEGQSIVIAGDAVMTRDFWRDRQGYFNSKDFPQASRTIEMLAETVDVIVPGHDNYFLNDRR
jgi:glyoxylase-like metal-dependent hydrolase (beta-lactamase superfamily II)